MILGVELADLSFSEGISTAAEWSAGVIIVGLGDIESGGILNGIGGRKRTGQAA